MVFETDKEYLERKKREYAQKGLKVDDEQAVIHDRHYFTRVGWMAVLGAWAGLSTFIAFIFLMIIIAFATST